MITELLEQLDTAYSHKNWPAVVNIDNKLRVTFERCIKDCQNNPESAKKLMPSITAAMGSYATLIQACNHERELLTDQQRILRKGQRISQQYLNCG